MNRRLEMITENQSDQNNQGDQGDCENRVCLLKRKRLTVTHICRYAINNLNGATSRDRTKKQRDKSLHILRQEF